MSKLALSYSYQKHMEPFYLLTAGHSIKVNLTCTTSSKLLHNDLQRFIHKTDRYFQSVGVVYPISVQIVCIIQVRENRKCQQFAERHFWKWPLTLTKRHICYLVLSHGDPLKASLRNKSHVRLPRYYYYGEEATITTMGHF